MLTVELLAAVTHIQKNKESGVQQYFVCTIQCDNTRGFPIISALKKDILKLTARGCVKTARGIPKVSREANVNLTYPVSSLRNYILKTKPLSLSRWKTEKIVFKRKCTLAKGNFQEFERLYKADTSRLNIQDNKGFSSLHYAAQNGHIFIVDYIVSQGGGIKLYS
ncbi:hypothetical protein KUTeg_016482 [Tegillarca granosa]|uniref:Uncharacterized protein n=1 Tax=Tegillarca granosa TaxID=220873 RepID=A0ABQ9EQS2_TEGGR|nr:hypothetical protein KUTeg_016482 [Tegillarca granosa]